MPGGPPSPALRAGWEAKESWVAATILEWDHPGAVAWIDDDPVGFAVFAPPRLAAWRHAGGPSPSADALLLATLWVDPAHRRKGVATTLVQAALRTAQRNELAALECYGRQTDRGDGGCVVAAPRWAELGFVEHRPHPLRPLWRLDLDRTVRWTDAVGAALDGALARLRVGQRGVPVTRTE